VPVEDSCDSIESSSLNSEVSVNHSDSSGVSPQRFNEGMTGCEVVIVSDNSEVLDDESSMK